MGCHIRCSVIFLFHILVISQHIKSKAANMVSLTKFMSLGFMPRQNYIHLMHQSIKDYDNLNVRISVASIIVVFKTHVPVVLWPSRHNFRDTELNFCINSYLPFIPSTH